MKINPVYAKELKLRSRTSKFAFTIIIYNAILIFIALLGFESVFNVNWNSYIDYSAASRIYFIIAGIEMVMLAFMIPAFTAGSIAGEREKQTLEILLTTTLKPEQIIVGKLMSSISMVLLLVVSSLPVISIIFTIGGVSAADLLRFLLLTFVFALYVGSMGMFASSVVKKTVQATVFTYGLGMIVCFVTAIVVFLTNLGSNLYYYNVMNGTGPWPDVTEVLYILLINPAFTTINMIFDQYGAYSAMDMLQNGLNGKLPNFVVEHWFWCSIAAQLLCTFCFVKLAAHFLNPLRVKKSKKKGRK